MATLPKASDIGSLQWDDGSAHAEFESDIDEFDGAVWVKLDAVVGQTYDLMANGRGLNAVDTSFEIYNAAGDRILSAGAGSAGSNAVLTADSTAPLYVRLFMASGFPGEIDLDVSTSNLTNHIFASGDDTYSGASGERVLGGYGNDTLSVSAAAEVSGGVGNDVIVGSSSGKAVIWGDQGDDSIDLQGSDDVVFGGAGDDNISSFDFGGNVQIFGGSGHDYLDLVRAATAIIHGGDQADYIRGSGKSDTIHGGTGGDFIYEDSGTNFLFGDGGNDVIKGGTNGESLDGGAGNDTISGNGGSDTMVGGTGNDQLVGGTIGDDITGGSGADVMTGGGGADLFIFQKASDSIASKSGRDIITDFDPVHYAMDLHVIDANTKVQGDQDFHWIGTQNFHHEAGDLRYVENGGTTYIYGDINGDNKGDFVVELTGSVKLTSINFIL
jgi:Ca2+-binding RTX toxin-like protein